MRTEEEINEQISFAIDIEAMCGPRHKLELPSSAQSRAEGVREALDWVLKQQDQPPFGDE